MRSLQWIVLFAAVGSFALAITLFGWPANLQDAGGLATFVAALMTPISLLLLLKTLERQEQDQRQSTRDGYLSVQVEALIALIEDDRAKLDGMTEKYRATNQKTPAFESVRRRYEQRVARLNGLLGSELCLPDVAEVSPAEDARRNT